MRGILNEAARRLVWTQNSLSVWCAAQIEINFRVWNDYNNNWEQLASDEKRITKIWPYGLSGKLMSRHRCKTMQALDFTYGGIWFNWETPPQDSLFSPPSHPSQRPAGGRWRAGPLCQGGSWRRRWRCRCRWSPGSWAGWSRHGGQGSPQTPAGPWMGPCCRHRGPHRCSGRSVKKTENIGPLVLWFFYSICICIAFFVKADCLLHPVVVKVAFIFYHHVQDRYKSLVYTSK